MTLLDFPGRVACTIFLGGCDFRCPYCHNYDLACGKSPVVMTEDELLSFLDRRAGLLEGAAVTGGEPCLHKDLPFFLSRIKSLGYAVKLDTNGVHPEMLAEILDRKLADYVAMDIKNSPEKYALTVGVERADLSSVSKSIEILMDPSSAVDYEFRTTVVDEFHTSHDFERIGEWIHGAKRYYLQAFTDRDSVPYDNLHAPSKDILLEYVQIMRAHIPDTFLRGVDV